MDLITKEKVIQRIQSQIAVCKEIDSDWISLTVGTGKRILELLDEQDEVIKTLSAFARADGIDVDILLGRKVKQE